VCGLRPGARRQPCRRKAVLGLLAASVPQADIVRQVALFGAQNRESWGVGLTILTSLANLLPMLSEEEAYLALFFGPAAHTRLNRASARRAHLAWAIDTHICLSEAMQPWFFFSFMEAKSFPPAERKIATDAEAATEEIFAEVVARGVASGDFIVDEAGLTASLIKPLLQDWYVKRTKYRRRGTSIEAYIASVTRFVEAALAAKATHGVRAVS
jgi:hypothetical protein